MKNVIATIIMILTVSSIIQAQPAKGSYVISLDPTIDVNRHHPYIEYFVQQDEEYIGWLYATNFINMEDHPQNEGLSGIIDNQNGNNSLVFTLTGENGIKYDTLRNSVHDFRESTDHQQSFVDRLLGTFSSKRQFLDQELKGSLPEGAMMWLEDKNWGLKFGVNVPEHHSKVEIIIRDDRGNYITTIINKELRKGWSNFKWKRGHHPRGVYNISVSINDQEMSQNFES